MSKKVIFVKQIEIDDEQDRFEVGKPIRGVILVDGDGAHFTPDKVHLASREIKAQARKVYVGPKAGAKSTIKVSGSLITHLELSREKAEGVGKACAEAELVCAFNEGWKELMKVG